MFLPPVCLVNCQPLRLACVAETDLHESEFSLFIFFLFLIILKTHSAFPLFRLNSESFR